MSEKLTITKEELVTLLKAAQVAYKGEAKPPDGASDAWVEWYAKFIIDKLQPVAAEAAPKVEEASAAPSEPAAKPAAPAAEPAKADQQPGTIHRAAAFDSQTAGASPGLIPTRQHCRGAAGKGQLARG